MFISQRATHLWTFFRTSHLPPPLFPNVLGAEGTIHQPQSWRNAHSPSTSISCLRMCFHFPHSKHSSANPSTAFSWVALCLSNPLAAGMSSKPIVDPLSHPLYLQSIDTRPLLLTAYWNCCGRKHKDTHSNNCIRCTLLSYFPATGTSVRDVLLHQNSPAPAKLATLSHLL